MQDLAGNPSADLPAQAYNFRAATDGGGLISTQTTASSTAVGVVILVVSLTVFCTLAAGIGVVKLWRSNATKLKAYLPKEGARRVPARSTPISTTVPDSSKPTTTYSYTAEKSTASSPFAEEKARAETAYRSAAAAAERLGKDAGAEAKPAPNAAWAQRPTSKTGPSPKVHPGREGFNAGRSRRSSPPPEGPVCHLLHLLRIATQVAHAHCYPCLHSIPPSLPLGRFCWRRQQGLWEP